MPGGDALLQPSLAPRTSQGPRHTAREAPRENICADLPGKEGGARSERPGPAPPSPPGRGWGRGGRFRGLPLGGRRLGRARRAPPDLGFRLREMGRWLRLRAFRGAFYCPASTKAGPGNPGETRFCGLPSSPSDAPPLPEPPGELRAATSGGASIITPFFSRGKGGTGVLSGLPGLSRWGAVEV